MSESRHRVSFQTIILVLCLVILASTLTVTLVFLNKFYDIAGDMQDSISTYQSIDQLSRNINDSEDAYQSFFLGLTGEEPPEIRSRGKQNILTPLYKAMAETNKLMVDYDKNPERYFLINAINSGLDYLENYVSYMESQQFPLNAETEFSDYYWGIKVYSYLNGYCYSQLLSQAVRNDSLASITNMGDYEAAKFYILDGHTRVPEILLGSVAALKKVSAEDLAIIKQCAKDTEEFEKTKWAEKEKQSEKIVREKGTTVIELTPEVLADFQSRMAPLYTKYGKGYEDIIKQIQDIGKKY